MALIYAIQHLHKQTFRSRVGLSDLTDDEVLQVTRMPRDAVRHWCDLLAADLTHATDRLRALSVETQILTAYEF